MCARVFFLGGGGGGVGWGGGVKVKRSQGPLRCAANFVEN